MIASIFLSHNHEDKFFVRKLARDLDNHNVKCWLDEAEIKIGGSLIEKIREGIDQVDYVAVILSPNSIASPWVQREVDVAMNQEINGRRVQVLPLMYRQCDLPGFLLGKAYADFTKEEKYQESFKRLIESIGLVFNKKALDNDFDENSLGHALDKAWLMSLPLYSKPFHRPYQYMGMTISQAAKAVNGEPNEVGNIIIDTDECHMLLEAEGNFISFVSIDLKRTSPCKINQEFDSESVLGALSINPSELEFARKKTHYHTYYDHRKKLKISVQCIDDGEALTVGFSSKYYGM